MPTYAGRPVFPPYFVDGTGDPQGSVSILVYLRGTTTKATVYTTRLKTTGSANPPHNPVTADSLGNANFFVDPGEYDALVNGLTLPFTVLHDPAELADVDLPWRNCAEFAVSPAHVALFGNGTITRMSALYGSLAAAQADYSTVVALTDTLDLVIIERAIRLSISAGTPSATRRTALNWLHLNTGRYWLNRTLKFISIQSMKFRGDGQLLTKFYSALADTTTDVVDMNGVGYCEFGDFGVVATGSSQQGRTAVNLHWTGAVDSLQSTTNVDLDRIAVFGEGGSFQFGIAIGTDNTLQNDNITVSRCYLQGGYSAGAPTQWLKGLSVGSGSAGNTLDIHSITNAVAGWEVGQGASGAGLTIDWPQHANNVVDFQVGTPGGCYAVRGGRSEGAKRLLVATGPGTSGGVISIRDLTCDLNAVHADGQVIQCNQPNLVLDNVSLNPTAHSDAIRAGAVKIRASMNQPNGGTAIATGCAGPELPEDFFTGNQARTVQAYRQIAVAGIVDYFTLWTSNANATPATFVAGSTAASIGVDVRTGLNARAVQLREDASITFGTAGTEGWARAGNRLLVARGADGFRSKVDYNHLGQQTNHSVAGPLTIDSADGEIVWVALTANVTALTVTNPVLGRILTIGFYQGGAGGFTYVWQPGVIWCTGGQPANNLTAGRIQSIDFYWDGFEWVEKGGR